MKVSIVGRNGIDKDKEADEFGAEKLSRVGESA